MFPCDYLADRPLPGWKVGGLLKLRNKILAGMPVDVLTAQTFNADTLQQVEDYLLGVLGKAEDPEDSVGSPDYTNSRDRMQLALHNWLCRFSGQPWSREKSAQLGTFAAGWAALFRDGHSPIIWTGRPPVWALLHVTDVRRLEGPKPNYLLTLDILAGPAGGITLVKHMPGPVIQAWLRELGAGVYKQTPPIEIGGLVLAATLIRDPASGRLVLNDVTGNSSVLGFNRKILKQRQNFCQHPQYRGRPCYNCRLGRDSCPLSRHLETYPIGFCQNSTIAHKGPLIGDWCIACLDRGLTPEPERKTWNKA